MVLTGYYRQRLNPSRFMQTTLIGFSI